VQFVDVTVDECGVGVVEALGESCEAWKPKTQST
jgi:hypothetical protein